jgi:hypothetical protein
LLQRGSDGSDGIRTDPVGGMAGQHELRKSPSRRLGTGTLACPVCDLPVAPPPGASAPADPLACPYCGHRAAVRDFLSLAAPSRPARVVVRVVRRANRSTR